MNWKFELLLQRFNVFLKNINTIYHAFEAFMMMRGFFFLRLVGCYGQKVPDDVTISCFAFSRE